jgi:hypothetical protein
MVRFNVPLNIYAIREYNLCRVLKIVIIVVLVVMSGLVPHMVSRWFGWTIVVELWFGGLLL